VSGPNKKFGLSDDEYIHFCFDKKGGESHRGDIKKKEKKK
jgi:hypothetical protein